MAVETTDPDDIDALRDETRRENAKLAQETRAQKTRRELKRDAGADRQEFRDQIDALEPATPNDVLEDHARETAEIENLDVLEGLRSLQTGDPILWRIYRTGHQDPDMNGFLETWPTSRLTQDRIRDEFGGGVYRVRGTHSDGRFAGGRTIHIAGDAKRKEKNDMGTASSNSGPNLVEFMTAQESRDAARRREEAEERKREKEERKEEEERRRKDRNELLAIVMPAVTGLTTAIVGAFSANKGPDIASLMVAMKGPDPITVLTQMRALDKSQGPDMVTKLLPLLLDKIGSGSGGSETGWMDIAKELVKSAGPTVGGMIEASVQAAKIRAEAQQSGVGTPPMTVTPTLSGSVSEVPALQPPRRRRNPSVNGPLPVESAELRGDSVHTAGANSPSMPVGGQVDMNLFALAPHLPWLKDQLNRMGNAAVRGKDPELYAALFLEELPEGIDINVVGQLLAAQDWFGKLCAVDGRLNREDFLPWFTSLRDHILRSLQAESGAHMAQHSEPQPSQDLRARTVVNVRGPGEVVDVAASASGGDRGHSAPARQTGEVERPQGLPSLGGDS